MMGANLPAPGSSAGDYLKSLASLLEFVKSPEYMERITMLEKMEAAALQRRDEADRAVAEATEARKKLAEEKAVHDREVSTFTREKQQHALKVSALKAATASMRQAITDV
jgi:hypothetical protein